MHHRSILLHSFLPEDFNFNGKQNCQHNNSGRFRMTTRKKNTGSIGERRGEVRYCCFCLLSIIWSILLFLNVLHVNIKGFIVHIQTMHYNIQVPRSFFFNQIFYKLFR